MANAQIEIEILGLAELRALPDRYQREAEHNYRRAMEESVNLLWASAVRKAPVNTGALRNSIQPKVEGHGLDVTGKVQSTLVYAPIMEYGRRPGARMPPPEALERWGQLVIGRAGLGYVLARAIARKGIKGRHFFRDALDEHKSEVQRKFQHAVDITLERAAYP